MRRLLLSLCLALVLACTAAPVAWAIGVAVITAQTAPSSPDPASAAYEHANGAAALFDGPTSFGVIVIASQTAPSEPNAAPTAYEHANANATFLAGTP